MRALPVLLIAACGAPPPAPVPLGRAVIATPRLAADDVEVARVNGRAVWASCVTAQAAAVAGDEAARRAAALDQCVAFELLAQAAEARGLAAAPEVAAAERDAEVNRLVELDFEQRYRTPADLTSALDVVMAKNAWRMHILELRASAFARFVVPDKAPPELDARAHALADRLAAELAGQAGLYPVHLGEAARRLAQGSGVELETSDVKPTHHDDLVAPYAAALYAIPEVGRTSAATRTQWGWDVVLWTGGVTAKERTRDEVVADLFPEVRRRQFQLWVTQLGKRLGLHIEVDASPLGELERDGASP